MKEAIKDSQEREMLNIKLHGKNKEKTQKLDEAKQREKSYQEQLKT